MKSNAKLITVAFGWLAIMIIAVEPTSADMFQHPLNLECSLDMTRHSPRSRPSRYPSQITTTIIIKLGATHSAEYIIQDGERLAEGTYSIGHWPGWTVRWPKGCIDCDDPRPYRWEVNYSNGKIKYSVHQGNPEADDDSWASANYEGSCTGDLIHRDNG
jgi:hypothetical protein